MKGQPAPISRMSNNYNQGDKLGSSYRKVTAIEPLRYRTGNRGSQLYIMPDDVAEAPGAESEV